MSPTKPNLDMDYTFSIIANSTGPFLDKDGVT